MGHWRCRALRPSHHRFPARGAARVNLFLLFFVLRRVHSLVPHAASLSIRGSPRLSLALGGATMRNCRTCYCTGSGHPPRRRAPTGVTCQQIRARHTITGAAPPPPRGPPPPQSAGSWRARGGPLRIADTSPARGALMKAARPRRPRPPHCFRRLACHTRPRPRALTPAFPPPSHPPSSAVDTIRLTPPCMQAAAAAARERPDVAAGGGGGLMRRP